MVHVGVPTARAQTWPARSRSEKPEGNEQQFGPTWLPCRTNLNDMVLKVNSESSLVSSEHSMLASELESLLASELERRAEKGQQAVSTHCLPLSGTGDNSGKD
jgi:hypothetical protein